MPNFNFTTDAQALSMLVLSWRRRDVPCRFIAGVPRTDAQTAEERRPRSVMKTGPGALVRADRLLRVPLDRSALGVKSPAQIGPGPLDRGRRHAEALRDDGRRFPRQSHRHDVGGAVRARSSSRPKKRKVALQKLREAFAEHQKQQAAGAAGPAVVSHQPGS
jgi:hypothetical protein